MGCNYSYLQCGAEQGKILDNNFNIIINVVMNPLHKGMGCTAEFQTFRSKGFVVGHIGEPNIPLSRQETEAAKHSGGKDNITIVLSGVE